MRDILLYAMLLVVIPGLVAQDIANQFLPEIDLYHRFNSDLVFWFQAKQTRENGDPVQAAIGPSLLYGSKRWLGTSGNKNIVIMSIGYRYLPSPDAPPVNRIEPIVFLNYTIPHKVLLPDRNRGDLDWAEGKFSWRYRNRLSVTSKAKIRGYEVAPLVAAEAFYSSRYGKWSDTALYAGCLFPIHKHVELNPYYEHQNATGKSPDQKLNQLGLMLSLFFGPARHGREKGNAALGCWIV